MQADVKTAKDIPLSLFMQLRSQYECEMGKTASDSCSSYTTGREYGEGSSGGVCEHREYSGGHQGCGAGCKCRSYSSTTKHHKKESAGFKSRDNVEKWINSRGDEIVILGNKTVLMSDDARGEHGRKTVVLENLPSGIGVRYPRNLSKNIYNLSDSSEDELEDNGSTDDKRGNFNAIISNYGNGVAIKIGNRFKFGDYAEMKNGNTGAHDTRSCNNGAPDTKKYNGNLEAQTENTITQNGNSINNHNNYTNASQFAGQYQNGGQSYQYINGAYSYINQIFQNNGNNDTREQYNYQYTTLMKSFQNGNAAQNNEINNLDSTNQYIYNEDFNNGHNQTDQYVGNNQLINQINNHEVNNENNVLGIQNNFAANNNLDESGIHNQAQEDSDESEVVDSDDTNDDGEVNGQRNGHNDVNGYNGEIINNVNGHNTNVVNEDRNPINGERNGHSGDMRNVGNVNGEGEYQPKKKDKYENWLKQMVDI